MMQLVFGFFFANFVVSCLGGGAQPKVLDLLGFDVDDGGTICHGDADILKQMQITTDNVLLNSEKELK